MSVFCGNVRWHGGASDADLSGPIAALESFPADEARSLVRSHAAFHQRTFRVGPGSVGDTLPRHDDAHGLTIAADAWLLYRDDLVRRLALDRARAWTDSELILQAYRRWGTDCPRHLEGTFAFVIWDERARRVVAARDAMGLRPLLYRPTADGLVLGSTVPAVVEPGREHEVNERYLASQLLRVPLPMDETSSPGVRRLPPGHWLSASADGVVVERYWSPEALSPLAPAGDEAYAEGVRDRLRDAVQQRCLTPYGVGATLSGGIDSGAIAAIAAPHLHEQGRPYKTVTSLFSADYDGPSRDERAVVESLGARFPGLDPEFVRPGEPFQYVPDQIDELALVPIPQIPGGRLHQRLLGSLGRRDVRVAFSGWSGDYLASRNTLQPLFDLARHGRVIRLAQTVRAHQRTRGVTARSLVRRWMAWETARLAHTAPLARSITSRRALREQLRTTFGTSSWIDRIRAEDLWGVAFREDAAARFGSVGAQAASQLPASMAYPRPDAFIGLGRQPLQEALPLCDLRLVEYLLRMPADQFIAGGHLRSPLRRAVAGILPDRVRLQQRKGRVIPDRDQVLRRAVPGVLSALDALPASAPAWDYLDRAQLLDALRAVGTQEAASSIPLRSWQALHCSGFALWLSHPDRRAL